MFRTHPELKAVGTEHEGAICYSKPAIVDVLVDWIVALRRLPGVQDVDVWMAENMQGKKGCQCDQCKGKDRSVMEARVIAAAYAKAKARVGTLGLRILTSEETENSNPEVFKTLQLDDVHRRRGAPGSLNRSAALLPKWESTLPMRPAGEDFTVKPVKVIHQVVDEMNQVAADLGINPRKCLLYVTS